MQMHDIFNVLIMTSQREYRSSRPMMHEYLILKSLPTLADSFDVSSLDVERIMVREIEVKQFIPYGSRFGDQKGVVYLRRFRVLLDEDFVEATRIAEIDRWTWDDCSGTQRERMELWEELARREEPYLALEYQPDTTRMVFLVSDNTFFYQPAQCSSYAVDHFRILCRADRNYEQDIYQY